MATSTPNKIPLTVKCDRDSSVIEHKELSVEDFVAAERLKEAGSSNQPVLSMTFVDPEDGAVTSFNYANLSKRSLKAVRKAVALCAPVNRTRKPRKPRAAADGAAAAPAADAAPVAA